MSKSLTEMVQDAKTLDQAGSVLNSEEYRNAGLIEQALANSTLGHWVLVDKLSRIEAKIDMLGRS